MVSLRCRRRSRIRQPTCCFGRQLLFALLESEAQSDRITVPEAIHSDGRGIEALQIELFHRHLWSLKDAEYVDWEREAHQVTKSSNFDRIHPIQKLFHAHRDKLPDGL